MASMMFMRILIISPLVSCAPNFTTDYSQNDSFNYELIPMSEYNLNSLIKADNYCDIKSCTEITCKNISQTENIGMIVSNFISTIFKIQCPHEREISTFKFISCSFSGNITDSSWLVTEYSVIEFIFDDCRFNKKELHTFSSSIFENTESLQLINTSVRILKKKIFERFNKLISLTIRDNLIEEIEFNLFENFCHLLEIIELNGSIKNEKVLKNMTSGVKLLNVKLISMQGNNISHLSPDIFDCFPNLLSIYLDSSGIKSIDTNTFRSLQSVQQIFLSNNLLSTLDENIFNALINPNLQIIMTDNPWNCDCQFEWIQRIIAERPYLFKIIPKCRTPDINFGLTFTEADFCGESESITTTRKPRVKKFSCQSIFHNNRTLPHLQNYKFPSTINNFYIKEYYNNNSVLVHLENSSNSHALIWFKNINKTITNIKCLINVNNSIILYNIEENFAYTLCLLDYREGFSPLNCLAMTPILGLKKNWLTKSDKPVAIIIVMSITSLSFIVGGVLSFVVVLKNPQMIRGNPRVIMVKQGQINTMILPKGALRRKDDNKLKDNALPEYLTPVTQRNIMFRENYYESVKKMTSSHDDLVGQYCIGIGDFPPPLPPWNAERPV